MKSQLGQKTSNSVASSAGHGPDDLATRLLSVCELFGSRELAAEAAGVHVDSLYKYLRGGTAPAFETMANLCKAKGISLDWLASGEGEMRRSIPAHPHQLNDHQPQWPARLEQPVDTLATIIATVDQLVSDLGIKADPKLKAQLVAGIYQNAAEYGSIEPVVEKLRLTLGALQPKSA